MDESIGKFCKTLAIFCNNLQNSCHALKESLDRRPIPLDSASTTFVQSLNQRVSSLSGDLNVLESMSCETVSFEELLGHCNEVFKMNQTHLLSLQDRLHNLGYISSIDLIDEDIEGEEEDAKVWEDLSPDCSLDLKKIEDDPLLDDSLNLQNLGLSDVCLATIASEANTTYEKEGLYLAIEKKQDSSDGKMNDELKSSEDIQSLITVSENDYENLPKHLKSLASWQDLVVAVEKMNSFLRTKKTRPYSFQQDEIAVLDLGHKARSYLLLLINMSRVIVETSDGLICYRIL
ncbi:uncharacterized protein LOC107819172 isoform X1 [Nicotiana tabacum]|uniref:Uncharacterized protein LOC107819172 isoform X1 n=2 Tax=Nicotiana TaxID=4085 RepID=A0A1S4CIA5_TOBAC|nr:PREDICTED: uncharacterized protein LOC104216511 isoform X1 [Nicotiana sylvestris]XP_016500744.1 PREDICTED: uncharacterized protein LOC107819172 [Nicotiana tabacum]